jgi:hypothetical protein
VPLVNTSSWAVIGKVLNSILGYAGMGKNVEVYYKEDDSFSVGSIISALNYGLDLTFNRIDFDNLSLHAGLLYKRGNYDRAAKNETYGLGIEGLFSSFPLAFTIDEGYKRFFSVSKYFMSQYQDTPYFKIGLSYNFGRINIGTMYQYDKVNKSHITIVLIARFGSYSFGMINPEDGLKTGAISYVYGFRYRHGAWR